MPDYYDKVSAKLKKQQNGDDSADMRTDERRSDGSRGRPMNAVDRLFIDESGKKARNYTGDEPSERDYRPVRQSHEYRSGCLGNLSNKLDF